MITKNANKVYRVYVQYGRGQITWADAIAKLLALEVPADQTSKVLLGTIMIAGK